MAGDTAAHGEAAKAGNTPPPKEGATAGTASLPRLPRRGRLTRQEEDDLLRADPTFLALMNKDTRLVARAARVSITTFTNFIYEKDL